MKTEKKADVYLLSNAHLDPVWLWRREEGIAETLSTFRVAADFCEEYEGYIFNHNESILYEWVEEHEPALFERIQRLVKEGKWRIMGGWYLQPDCNMPSGESIFRQIEVGNRYFMEKFGVKPTTAICFDAFGHNRGLVQILQKSGYENYLFMRPYSFVPEHDFIWKGYDGSEILGHCMWRGYNSLKGSVGKKLADAVKTAQEEGVSRLMLWGVGNHGGGPSKMDMEAIAQYQKEHPEVTVIHSGCEEYFAQVDKSKLARREESLVPAMVGCYTSMVRIKQLHRQLENKLTICEKMIASSGASYDKEELAKAEKALLFCEFHDILPGTVIKKAEEDSLRQLYYGLEIVSNCRNKLFFQLCAGQRKGNAGEIPVMVYNPNPYPVCQEIEIEFLLENQNHAEHEVTLAKVRDEKGNYLPTQNEKESSMLNLDWRKRVVFRGELAPMQITRFDCELYIYPEASRPIATCQENDTHFLFDNGRMQASINKKSGLLDSYVIDGETRLKENSGQIKVYEDDSDPWGSEVDGFYNCMGAFEPVSDQEANAFNGYPNENIANVRIIENGDVRMIIQAVMKYDNSYAVVNYTFPKNDTYIDIQIKMLSNDVNRMYKLAFETTYTDSTFMGQGMFGREMLKKEEKEMVYQKWCGLFVNESQKNATGFAVLNSGTHGGSAKDGTLQISLLRTPIYSNLPIGDRPLSDPDRCHDHIDIGDREFTYRLVGDVNHLDAQAEVYNQQPYALSFFPSGAGKKPETTVSIDNREVLLTSLKPIENGKVQARIFNTSGEKQTVTLQMSHKEVQATLGAFEIQTLEL